MTARDRRLLRFIDDFGVATTDQIKRYFFPSVSYQRCCQRLTELYRSGQLKRKRNFIQQQYLYYTARLPKQINHHLKRTESYIVLQSGLQLVRFDLEYAMKGLRADAYFEVWDGDTYGVFLEIQTDKQPNIEKYKGAFLKWKKQPMTVWVSDNNTTLPFPHISTDTKGLLTSLQTSLHRVKEKGLGNGLLT
jgi:hypothetical protein